MRSLPFIATALAVALLAAPGSALGGVQRAHPDVLEVPFTTSGPLLEDDVKTVAHVTWNGSALVDSYGNSWTQNGTVPQVSTSPLFPGGFAGSARAGAGPMTATNFYSLGSGADVLDFTATTGWTLCVVYRPTTITSAPVVFSDGVFGDTGYYLQVGSSGSGPSIASAASSQTPSAGNSAPGAVSILCGGMAAGGTTLFAKLNGGTTTSVAAVTLSQDSTHAARIGRYSSAGLDLNGAFFELWGTTTPWLEANVAAIERRVVSNLATGGEPFTFARASTGTFTVGSTVFTAPVNTTRIDAQGFLAEPGRTNVEIRSQEFENAAWTATNVTVTADSTAAPDPGATVTADTIAGTGAGGVVQTTTGIAPALSVHTGSIYLKTTAGSQLTAFKVRDINGNAAAAWAATTAYADGTYIVPQAAQANNHFYKVTAHTTGLSGGLQPTWPTAPASTVVDVGVTWTEQGLIDHCSSTPTATTSWGRYTCTGTTVPETTNSFGLFLYPGGTGGTGTVIAWGAQLEAGAFATSYIATVGTSVARTTDGAGDVLAAPPVSEQGRVSRTWVPMHSSAQGSSSVLCTGNGFLWNSASGALTFGACCGNSIVHSGLTWAAGDTILIRGRWTPSSICLSESIAGAAFSAETCTTGITAYSGAYALFSRIGIGENGSCGTGEPSAHFANLCFSRNPTSGCW